MGERWAEQVQKDGHSRQGSKSMLCNDVHAEQDEDDLTHSNVVEWGCMRGKRGPQSQLLHTFVPTPDHTYKTCPV